MKHNKRKEYFYFELILIIIINLLHTTTTVLGLLLWLWNIMIKNGDKLIQHKHQSHKLLLRKQQVYVTYNMRYSTTQINW